MSVMTVDPTGKMDNSAVPDGANIDQAKLQTRARATYGQAGGADAAAADVIVHRAYKASTVLAATITPDAVPAGGTKTLTIDVKKSTAGGAWSSILSATTTLNTSSVARTPVALSLSGTPTLLAGDALRVSITVGGTGGTGVQGFVVDLVLAENGS